MNKKLKLLILGKLPPPIGGVTIHTKRLIDYLEQEQVPFKFVELSLLNFLLFPFYAKKYSAVHLHTSNILVMKIIVFFTKILQVKTIITFHGDLERFNDKKKLMVLKIIKEIDFPILLNEGSYKIANKLNPNSQLISAFIPPYNEPSIDSEIRNNIKRFIDSFDFVYATNAYSFTYDKFNTEIYGIIDLIKYFSINKNIALIILDPSGTYCNYLKKNDIVLTNNIYLITNNHSFYEILKLVNGSIRNTSTDGDSLSVRESIYLNKLTLATDVVSRPLGTVKYKRGEYQFVNFTELDREFQSSKENRELPNYHLLLDIYK